MTEHEDTPSAELLAEIEQLAVELAQLAGAEITTALGSILAVRYKSGAEVDTELRDPVSEVDHRVEVLIRARLADRFPDHDVIGEEMAERPGLDHEFIWAIDPVDGTSNFINGFPLFAASIGVMHRCRPVVGAVWCAASHALRPGVYHARDGGALHFEREPLKRERNPHVRRRLAGSPNAASDRRWDIRKTGSAAIECAFVAAGLLDVTRFNRPNIWDVAGGLPLVLAAGGEVLTQAHGGWETFDRFHPRAGANGEGEDLRHWRSALILGNADSGRELARTSPR